MSGYHVHEGLLELPEGWEDRSINIFSRELAPNQIASIVITRDTTSEPLSAFVDKTMKSLAKQLPRFMMFKRVPSTFGAIEGEDVSFQWRREGMDIYQRQAFLPVAESKLLTFTISAPVKYRNEVDAELLTVVGDFKLRLVE
jgi:hypothetical protein